MPTPDFARSPHVLRQRVRRLLGLGETKHEISGTILPFLGGLGTVSLIGGAVRDVARAGRQGFSSDLDFVRRLCTALWKMESRCLAYR
jgi:hypothetical protein